MGNEWRWCQSATTPSPYISHYILPHSDVTDNDRRRRRQTPATVTSLAPTLCVGGPVITSAAHNVWITSYTATSLSSHKYHEYYTTDCDLITRSCLHCWLPWWPWQCRMTTVSPARPRASAQTSSRRSSSFLLSENTWIATIIASTKMSLSTHRYDFWFTYVQP